MNFVMNTMASGPKINLNTWTVYETDKPDTCTMDQFVEWLVLGNAQEVIPVKADKFRSEIKAAKARRISVVDTMKALKVEVKRDTVTGDIENISYGKKGLGRKKKERATMPDNEEKATAE